MSKLAISKFFEHKLEAPLHNTVWSWGSENAKGIYLRAWNLRDPHFFSPELSRTYRFEASYG